MKPTWAILAVVGLAWLAGGCGLTKPSKDELVNAGMAHLYRAEYAQAIGYLKEATKRDPEDSEVHANIGQCYFYLGEYGESIFWYRLALTCWPGNPRAKAGLAMAEQRLASLSPTTVGVSSRLEEDRAYALRLIEIARAYEDRQEHLKAEDYFRKAIDVNEDLAYPHAELGRFYMRRNQIDRAVEELQRAYAINPAEPQVAQDLAKVRAGT